MLPGSLRTLIAPAQWPWASPLPCLPLILNWGRCSSRPCLLHLRGSHRSGKCSQCQRRLHCFHPLFPALLRALMPGLSRSSPHSPPAVAKSPGCLRQRWAASLLRSLTPSLHASASRPPTPAKPGFVLLGPWASKGVCAVGGEGATCPCFEQTAHIEFRPYLPQGF